MYDGHSVICCQLQKNIKNTLKKIIVWLKEATEKPFHTALSMTWNGRSTRRHFETNFKPITSLMINQTGKNVESINRRRQIFAKKRKKSEPKRLKSNHEKTCSESTKMDGNVTQGSLAPSKKMKVTPINSLQQQKEKILPDETSDSQSRKPEGTVQMWKKMLDRSGPTWGSTSMRLHRENRWLANAVGLCKYDDAEIVDYNTIKDKHDAKIRKHRFAPKALSQWHWFFVGSRIISPVTENFAKFTLSYDKFQLAQGNCMEKEMVKGRRVFTYGCGGAKLLKTSSKRKRDFIQQVMTDTDEKRKIRLEHAKKHKDGLTHYGNRTVRFVDIDGKETFYSGMPIGGEHDWDYQDAEFIEKSLTDKAIKKWTAKNVRWREVKVHQGRWEIFVSGELHLNHGNLKEPCETTSVLIADQMATKLTPASYHVELRGIQIPICKKRTRLDILKNLVMKFENTSLTN
eukprot:jgi/Bigna1/140674/aug1.57_g15382